MAYTYEDFVKAANSSGMLSKFNKYDLETAKQNPEFGLSMLSLMKDAAGSGTQEAKLLADAGINSLRKTYGNYTIADDGTYTFAGGNDAKIAELTDAVTNPQPFTYNEETDPLFGSYKKTYLREGERAGANALAQMAAANGGQVSTSALAASQQAQNYYNAQLADIIPTLRQNAYNEHMQELAKQQNALDVLLAERQTEYNEFLDRETLANNAINNALVKFQTLGYATPDVAAVLGIKEGTVYPSLKSTGTTGDVVVEENNPGEEPESDPDDFLANLVIPTPAEPTPNNNIKTMQLKLGVPPTGIWDKTTAAAAKKQWGTPTVKPAWVYYNTYVKNSSTLDVYNLIEVAAGKYNAEQIAAAMVDPVLMKELATWLNEQVVAGELVEYVKEGKVKFRKKA